MAAEVAAGAGARVTVYDRMPAPGRKLLLAGRGGLNLTHAEPFETFVTRYGAATEALRPALLAFPPAVLRAWTQGLGQETFVGSSGRVFPRSWKASPLLRAWLARLGQLGVAFAFRQLWLGFGPDLSLLLRDPDGVSTEIRPDAAILALGGASWPRLGADGSWVTAFREAGIPVTPLQPANCGLGIAWSETFRSRFAGVPIKRAVLAFGNQRVAGEPVVTEDGLEGGPVYALSGLVRDALAAGDRATIQIDLRPDLSQATLAASLARPRGKASFATFLRKSAGLSPVAVGLLREIGGRADLAPDDLARQIKALPLTVDAVAGLDRAISTAGGVAFTALDAAHMLRSMPGIFVAGEMLDWEAPTGGYLLQASFATGAAAARGALAWIGGAVPPVNAEPAFPPHNR